MARDHKLACNCCVCKSKRGEYTGENSPHYRKKWSVSRRRALSEARKGSGNPMFGKKRPEHSKKLKGRKRPDVSLGNRVDNPNRRLGAKERLSERMSGDKNPAKRPEVRKKMSGSRPSIVGVNNPFYGKTHTDESKQKNREAHSGENSSVWKGGISKEPYPFAFGEELKHGIRVRDDFQCQFCGSLHGYSDGRVHPVHHIDYDKFNIESRNLITLCSSCNSRANVDRDKWQFMFEVLQEIRLCHN